MKFFVVLICVTANYFWKQDYDRISDTWFEKFRLSADNFVAGLEIRNNRLWVVGLIATFLLPLFVLAVVLFLVEGIFFGLLTVLIHIFILLMAFDRIHPSLIASEYLAYWRENNLDGCYSYLQKELTSRPVPRDYQGLHDSFCTLFVYRCFEKMFVMFFCYLLAGPIAVLFAYICYQHRDGDSRIREDKESGVVSRLIAIVEWAPLRLLGLTMNLVGDFENGFARLKQTGLINDLETDVTLYEYARYSLGLYGVNNTVPNASRPEPTEGDADYEIFKVRVEHEVNALQALTERSQIIWVCVIALIIVLMFSI